MPTRKPTARRRTRRRYRQQSGRRFGDASLNSLTSDELLDMRMSDLPVRIEGTPLEDRIEQLNEELASRGLRFRPHFWLSDEWFTPDGVPGVAIPFYLAHSRLMRLEAQQMLEVEGGNEEWCMKILRHEAGHAIDNAYNLRRMKRYREVFGPASLPYRYREAESYRQPHPIRERAIRQAPAGIPKDCPTHSVRQVLTARL